MGKKYFYGKEELENYGKDKECRSCFDDGKKKVFKVKIRDEFFPELSDMIKNHDRKVDDICSSYVGNIYPNQVIKLLELNQRNKTLTFMVIRN